MHSKYTKMFLIFLTGCTLQLHSRASELITQRACVYANSRMIFEKIAATHPEGTYSVRIARLQEKAVNSIIRNELPYIEGLLEKNIQKLKSNEATYLKNTEELIVNHKNKFTNYADKIHRQIELFKKHEATLILKKQIIPDHIIEKSIISSKFLKETKNMDIQMREVIVDKMSKILDGTLQGEPKRPLFSTNVRTLKFSGAGGAFRMSYAIHDHQKIEFLFVGSRENYYDDLKKFLEGHNVSLLGK